MEDGEPISDGLVASAKRLGSSVLGLLQTRIELLAVELQEEKLRALDLLALMTAAIAFAVGAILLAIGTAQADLHRQLLSLESARISASGFGASAVGVVSVRRWRGLAGWLPSLLAAARAFTR